jgi:hypothetical protein
VFPQAKTLPVQATRARKKAAEKDASPRLRCAGRWIKMDMTFFVIQPGLNIEEISGFDPPLLKLFSAKSFAAVSSPPYNSSPFSATIPRK